MVPAFNNAGEMSKAKNYFPVNLYSVFSKIFEKHVHNRIADQLKICGLFCDF